MNMKKKLLSVLLAASLMATSIMSLGAWAADDADSLGVWNDTEYDITTIQDFSATTDDDVTPWPTFGGSTARANRNTGSLTQKLTPSVGYGYGTDTVGLGADWTTDYRGFYVNVPTNQFNGDGIYVAIKTNLVKGSNATNWAADIYAYGDSINDVDNDNWYKFGGSYQTVTNFANTNVVWPDGEDVTDTTVQVFIPYSYFSANGYGDGEFTADSLSNAANAAFGICFGKAVFDGWGNDTYIYVSSIGTYAEAGTDEPDEPKEPTYKNVTVDDTTYSVGVVQDFEDFTDDDLSFSGGAATQITKSVAEADNNKSVKYEWTANGMDSWYYLRVKLNTAEIFGEGLYFEVTSNWNVSGNCAYRVVRSNGDPSVTSNWVAGTEQNISGALSIFRKELPSEDGVPKWAVMIPWTEYVGLVDDDDNVDLSAFNAADGDIYLCFGIGNGWNRGRVAGDYILFDDIGCYAEATDEPADVTYTFPEGYAEYEAIDTFDSYGEVGEVAVPSPSAEAESNEYGGVTYEAGFTVALDEADQAGSKALTVSPTSGSDWQATRLFLNTKYSPLRGDGIAIRYKADADSTLYLNLNQNTNLMWYPGNSMTKFTATNGEYQWMFLDFDTFTTDDLDYFDDAGDLIKSVVDWSTDDLVEGSPFILKLGKYPGLTTALSIDYIGFYTKDDLDDNSSSEDSSSEESSSEDSSVDSSEESSSADSSSADSSSGSEAATDVSIVDFEAFTSRADMNSAFMKLPSTASGFNLPSLDKNSVLQGEKSLKVTANGDFNNSWEATQIRYQYGSKGIKIGNTKGFYFEVKSNLEFVATIELSGIEDGQYWWDGAGTDARGRFETTITIQASDEPQYIFIPFEDFTDNSTLEPMSDEDKAAMDACLGQTSAGEWVNCACFNVLVYQACKAGAEVYFDNFMFYAEDSKDDPAPSDPDENETDDTTLDAFWNLENDAMMIENFEEFENTTSLVNDYFDWYWVNGKNKSEKSFQAANDKTTFYKMDGEGNEVEKSVANPSYVNSLLAKNGMINSNTYRFVRESGEGATWPHFRVRINNVFTDENGYQLLGDGVALDILTTTSFSITAKMNIDGYARETLATEKIEVVPNEDGSKVTIKIPYEDYLLNGMTVGDPDEDPDVDLAEEVKKWVAKNFTDSTEALVLGFGLTETELEVGAKVYVDNIRFYTEDGMDELAAAAEAYRAANGDDDYTAMYDSLNGAATGAQITYLEEAFSNVDPNPSYDKGDVDRDGSVTARDALQVLRFTVGLDQELMKEVFDLADMNEDSVVSAWDALMILRQTVGLD